MKKALNGVTVIVVGGILLANTTGYLPWGVWWGIFSLWPLLVVAVGGCSMSHAEREQKAEHHWNAVRAQIKVQLAHQQFDHGRVPEAVSLLDEALDCDPENGKAYLLLARCHLEGGKLPAAARAAQKAADYTPPSAKLFNVRGLVAERQGRLEDALLMYRQARGMDDSDVTYLLSEAECLVALSRVEEADELLRANTASYGHDVSLGALLGEIALRQGNEREAARQFRMALGADSDDPVIAEEYAILAVRAGDYVGALRVLEPLLKERGKDATPSVVCAAAQSMLALNRTEVAKLTLTRLLLDHPDDLAAWVLLAKAGIMTDDRSTMQRAVRQAVRIAPGDPRTLWVEAYVSLREGETGRAERALTRLLVASQDDVLAHCMLGLAAQRTTDEVAARRHFQRALEVDPNCTWARSALRMMDVSSRGETDSAPRVSAVYP